MTALISHSHLLKRQNLETVLLTPAEQRVLQTFRRFLIAPGQMLCFCGPTLKKHRMALKQLTDKEMLIKEQFEGGYSLTSSGFQAMKGCD